MAKPKMKLAVLPNLKYLFESNFAINLDSVIKVQVSGLILDSC